MHLIGVLATCAASAAIVILIGQVHFALGFVAMFPVYAGCRWVLDRY